jgi:probable phosphoglycerate mutase
MRHGHTAANARAELHGWNDDPLDDVGLQQAAALGMLFDGVPLAAVYASPLQRAWQTAEPVAAVANVDMVHDRSLMDRDYGPWTGHPKSDVEAEFGTIDAAPGVEPWEEFTDRVAEAVAAVVARHDGLPVAIVGHDASNQAYLCRLFPGRWPGPHAIPQRNGCWNRLDRAGAAWELAVLDALPGDGTQP